MSRPLPRVKGSVDGTLKINTTDGDLSAGGVALPGDTPKFDTEDDQGGSLKEVGYYTERAQCGSVKADDDIDDAADDLVLNDAFDVTTVGFTYDAERAR